VLAAAVIASLWYDLGRFYLYQGGKHLTAGNYSAARDNLYKALRIRHDESSGRFILGVVRYRAGEYSKAFADFSAAVSAGDQQLKQKARYNQGNCLVRMAEQTAFGDPVSADRLYRKALDRYREVLQQSPRDSDTLANLATVSTAREALSRAVRSKLPEKNRTASKNPADSSSNVKNHEIPKNLQPASSRSQSGQPTAANQEGTARQHKTMRWEEAERLLNEKRRQEALPSSIKAAPGGSAPAPSAKDW
jgi:tetratricopeptide (TPR) repeat protein